MTINELILLVESAGFHDITDMRSKEALGCLEYFASKVAAQAKKEEREECAKLCDLHAREIDNTNNIASWLAKAIRERERERVSIVTKTQDLSGPALDWAVAKIEYPEWDAEDVIIDVTTFNEHDGTIYRPSIDWSQGGPIIEEHEITIRKRAPYFNDEKWEALGSITAKGAGYGFTKGPTPLIAAMRLYVEANLGKEVEIPEELL